MDGPAHAAVAVTPHNSTHIPGEAIRAPYVGTTGNVAVVFSTDGAPVVFTAVPAGTVLPIRAVRVNNTGTTASNIVGLR